MTPGLTISICLVCLALSFLLSGMEAGVAALSPIRIRRLMRAGNPSARVLQQYLERPEPFLWTIITGNTLVNFIAFAVVTHWLITVLGQRPAWLTTSLAVGALAFYGGVELLPKLLFRAYPNRLCLLLARPFQALDLVLSPLVGVTARTSRWILRWTGRRAFTGHVFATREELRFVMQQSSEGLTSAERTMINRVLDLQNLTVGSLTTPMTKVASIEASAPLLEAVRVCRERQLTRLPVWQTVGGSRRVAGIVSLKTMLYAPSVDASRRAGDYLQPALFLDGTLRLEEALRRMQRSGQRLGVVLDRDQREIGIVTLQDILKVIFGEVSL